MTNEEINRYIHIEMMGNECYHRWKDDEERKKPNFKGVAEADNKCVDCGHPHTNYDYGWPFSQAHTKPDYCSNDSPRRLLNEVVAKLDAEKFGLAMWDVLEMGIGFYARGIPDFKAVKATAEQIATACVKAHKESK